MCWYVFRKVFKYRMNNILSAKISLSQMLSIMLKRVPNILFETSRFQIVWFKLSPEMEIA